MVEFCGSRHQSGSSSLSTVGSGFHCLRSLSFLYTVYDRTFGDFPDNITVYTPLYVVLAQPFNYTVYTPLYLVLAQPFNNTVYTPLYVVLAQPFKRVMWVLTPFR